MTKVYIAQLKCPNNHCILALAGEYDEGDADAQAKNLAYRLTEKFSELVDGGTLRRECGLCKATDLTVQVDATRFRTMKEAEPALRESAEAQAQSAAWLKSSRN
jgi:hypothetical protein